MHDEPRHPALPAASRLAACGEWDADVNRWRRRRTCFWRIVVVKGRLRPIWQGAGQMAQPVKNHSQSGRDIPLRRRTDARLPRLNQICCSASNCLQFCTVRRLGLTVVSAMSR